MNGMRKRFSKEQMHLLISYLEKYPALAKGGAAKGFPLAEKYRLWTYIAKLLNTCDEYGCQKSSHKWLRSWTDYKSELKRKFLRSKDNPNQEFTDLEKRALDLIELRSKTPEREQNFTQVIQSDYDPQSSGSNVLSSIKQELTPEGHTLQEVAFGDSTIPILVPKDLLWPDSAGPTVLQLRPAEVSDQQQPTTPKLLKQTKSSQTKNDPKPNESSASSFFNEASSEQIRNLVEAQEATAVSLNVIANEFQRRNDLEEERLVVEKRKACAFEAIAEFYKLKSAMIKKQ